MIRRFFRWVKEWLFPYKEPTAADTAARTKGRRDLAKQQAMEGAFRRISCSISSAADNGQYYVEIANHIMTTLDYDDKRRLAERFAQLGYECKLGGYNLMVSWKETETDD